jgi:hypothetical protein
VIEEMGVRRNEAYLEMSKANPEKTKTDLEAAEAAVDIFKRKLGKMESPDLEANPEAWSISKSVMKRSRCRLLENEMAIVAVISCGCTVFSHLTFSRF